MDSVAALDCVAVLDGVAKLDGAADEAGVLGACVFVSAGGGAARLPLACGTFGCTALACGALGCAMFDGIALVVGCCVVCCENCDVVC